MATISIPYGDTLTFTAVQVIQNETIRSVETTTKYVSFDLSELGNNPVVTGVSLRCLSSHQHDFFVVREPIERNRNLTVGTTPTQLNELIPYVTGGTLTLAIKYLGRIAGIHYATTNYFKATASFALIVELESEPVFDSRSSGSLSATSVDFGQNITFNIEPFRDTYRHQIIYSVGNYTGRSAMLNAGVTSCTFSPPLAWITEVPNSDTGTMKVLLDTLRPVDTNDPNTTYTSVGTREYNVQVKVPSNLYPTISNAHFEIVNPRALPQNRVFTGVSRIKITLDSVSGSAGSSIASIRYSGWGDTVTTTNPQSLTNIVLTTNVVRATGSITILVDITDSRGRSIGIGFDMGQAIQYIQPSLTVAVCRRCTPEGEDQDRGTAVRAVAAFHCDSHAIAGNTARAYMYIRQLNGEWSQRISLSSGVERIVTDADIGYELSHEMTYEVRFVVADDAMSVEQYVRLQSLQFMLYFANNGRAIGIGKQADDLTTGQEGRLDVNPDWSVYLGEHTYIGGTLLDMTAINNLITTLDTLSQSVSTMQTQIGALQTAVTDIQNQLDPPESTG